MLLATLRKMVPGSSRSARRKPAVRRPVVEQLEDRRQPSITFGVPAVTLMTWAEGTDAPPAAAVPLSPAPLSLVFFTLPTGTHPNACYAEAALGGRPALAINEAAHTIDLFFQPPPPGACLDVYMPVSGLYGGIFLLDPGTYTMTGLPGSSVTFTVVGAPFTLPQATVDIGQVSYVRYGDPAYRGEDLVIEDRDTWERFWTMHKSGVFPMPPLPEIDFDREMVLVTTMGYYSTMGPHTTIDGVDFDPTTGRMTVRVTDHRTPGLLPTVSNPFHIVRIPRLPYTSIVFEHQDA